MPRSLLVSTLLVVQLLSWSGPSLYLCLGRDGSINVDFGPASCHRCRRHCGAEADECDPNHDHHQCLQGSNGGERPTLVVADRDCDCSHIQIVQQQGPTVVQKSLKQSSDHGCVLGPAIWFQQIRQNIVAVDNVLNQPVFTGSSSCFPALLALVVLRC
jgi:hypothetical protein